MTKPPRCRSRDPVEDENLQKLSQNPVADLVSVPFQSNTNFNTGQSHPERAQHSAGRALYINNDWNLISPIIAPLISQLSPLFDNTTNGIGDVTQELFRARLHHAERKRSTLGTGKVLLGPPPSNSGRSAAIRCDRR